MCPTDVISKPQAEIAGDILNMRVFQNMIASAIWKMCILVTHDCLENSLYTLYIFIWHD